MSAQTLGVITLAFPDPSGSTLPGEPKKVDPNLSFQYGLQQNIRTLSTNDAATGNDITGLLYTPDLAPDDPCVRASEPYVPANATRQANFPNNGRYALVALAPWISPTCTLSYLAAARNLQTQGFLFFLPDNSTGEPPPASDSTWSLGDNGNWKQDNSYPVYVVPGATGFALINATANYSGNISSVPNGEELLNTYDPTDYVRLYVDIDTGESNSQFGSASHLPSLWVFLLVVLAILLIIIGATSILMHWVQRRRRQRLRRRVVTGEVDLEVLGIKRLTVPQELLDKMPLYTYGTVRPDRPANAIQPTETSDKGASPSSASRSSSPSPDIRPTAAMARAHSYRPSALDQPTCPICLDDFVPADPSTNEPGNTVRELPCHHIFHPECVDAFLRDNSSLCPMCKKTCLPPGFCPKNVTNAMVRRERIMRRNRERGGAVESQPTNLNSTDIATIQDNIPQQTPSHPTASLSQRIARRITSAPASSNVNSNSQQMVELSSTQQRSATGAVPLPPPVPPADANRRREWARQRAVAMLGRRAPPLDPDAEEAARTPRWRKVVGSIFPGIGGR